MKRESLDPAFCKKIEPIQVVMAQGEWRLVFPQDLPSELFDILLESMMENGLCFSIYDALYPSVSDPGAYFHYSPDNGIWRMSLGNHGWSDGVYAIDSALVAGQLHNLYQHHLLQELDLEQDSIHVGRSAVSTQSNSTVVNRMSKIHIKPLNPREE